MRCTRSEGLVGKRILNLERTPHIIPRGARSKYDNEKQNSLGAYGFDGPISSDSIF